MKRWPRNKAAFWESAPFFRLLLPLVVGIFAYYSIGAIVNVAKYSPCAAAVFFALYSFQALKKVQARHTAWQTFVYAQLLLFSAAVSLAYLYDVKNNRNWFGKDISMRAIYMARLADDPKEGQTTWKLQVQVMCSIQATSTTQTTGDAFVYVYKEELPMPLHKGDTVLLPGAWQPIRNAGNPFEFDYAGYCRRNNIYYRQTCHASEVRLLGAQELNTLPITEQLHDWCASQLNKYISDAKTRGLLQAMLLGDETGLDNDIRQSFTDTGIVHIVAISGGNITMFFMLISALLWWMKDKRLLWVKYAIALPLVWCYVIMAGASPSAVRAAIMFTLLAVGIILQKNSNNLNQLFATAFLLLCAEPAWLYSLGFQLSFLAVLSLILFYTPIYKRLKPRNYFLRQLWATAAASMAAEILVAPLVICYFHTFPLMFLLANIAGYVFMGLVLILGIAIIALSWLPAAASFIGLATIKLVHWFDRILEWLQQFNPHNLQLLTLSAAELAFVYLSIACIAVYLFKQRKPALVGGAVALVLLGGLLGFDEWQWRHQRRLVVYNAGKEVWAELIEGKTHYVLASDTTTNKKVEYATKSAHIGWHTQSGGRTADSIFKVGGKSIILVRNSPSDQTPRHADYVLTMGADIDPALIKTTYSPSTLVITNMKRKQASDYCSECERVGLNVHNVAESGAFIVE